MYSVDQYSYKNQKPVQQQSTEFVSEVFPITLSETSWVGFSISPTSIDRSLGKRIAYRLTKYFPHLIVVWVEDIFFAVAKIETSPSQNQLPNEQQWQTALDQVAAELGVEIGWRYQPTQKNPQPYSMSELAATILTYANPFKDTVATRIKGIEVIRVAHHWAELYSETGELQPGIAITVKSKFLASSDLAVFYNANKNREDIRDLLVGMDVEEADLRSCGTVVDLVFPVSEHRERLLRVVKGKRARVALENAPGDQPLAAVKFQKDGQPFYYALSALRPVITKDTADKYEVDYGWLLKQTKLPHDQRQSILFAHIEAARKCLMQYGFELGKSINSASHPNLWLIPQRTLERIPLLFGNGVIGGHNRLLSCLKEGGVYQQSHSHTEPIRLATLRLSANKISNFLDPLKARFQEYGFELEVTHKISVDLTGTTLTSARAMINTKLEELLQHKDTDLVLTVLPDDDRYNVAESSLYQCVYSYLLSRTIASQFIFDKTIRDVPADLIFNQIAPGILGKLGYIPFVLASPLPLGCDLFIGLDVARRTKSRRAGTINACASVRIYGSRGEFVGYQLIGDSIEGEEIPPRVLERLLSPNSLMANKTIGIYRDGKYVGQEAEYLVDWASNINSQLVLLEIRKSQIPRLYSSKTKQLGAPPSGLGLRLTSHQGLLVTTEVSQKLGLSRPLRLVIHPLSQSVGIEDVVETTRCLTLLHYGSTHIPRVPPLIMGSDKMGYLQLIGIYPTRQLSGDRQFWL